MPTAGWIAATALQQQAPVYFLRIDGLSKDYSTHTVKNAATTKTVLMDLPRGGGAALDLLAGTQTVQEVEVELLDVADEITDLVATEAAGAPLATLINRKATIYGGYRSLDEADYAERFTGRIRDVEWNEAGTGYVFRIASADYLLDGQIMVDATEAKPAAIKGNVANVYASILRGIFSVSDPDFPLTFVSTATATTSAPTGLGIPDALLDFVRIKAQRDTWHTDDLVHAVWSAPVDARTDLTRDCFRPFQAFAPISGAGLLGLQFHVPSLPLSSAVALTKEHIIEVRSWRRLFDHHLNHFTVKGDYSEQSRAYETTLYETEDTADQAATGETLEYLVESRWLRQDLDGEEIAWELANRMKLRFLKTPAQVVLLVDARKQELEQGQVVAVTDADLPDLFTGARGVTTHMMTILAVKPDWETGALELTLLDTGGKRYGLMGPESGVPSYATATQEQRETYFYLCGEAGLMSDATDGYRFA